MATQKVLTVHNQIPGSNILMIVSSDGFNCCDTPVPQQIYGGVAYNASTPVNYLRKDGHGCNGRQGQFVFMVYINSILAGEQAFDFDSDGGIELSSNPTSGFKATLTTNDAGGDYYVMPL